MDKSSVDERERERSRRGLTQFVTNRGLGTSGAIAQLDTISKDTKSDGTTNSFY
jgi:hypothetical protein